jgi:hypothetical protein
VLVDPVVPVEQGAVHVGDDQSDVWALVEDHRADRSADSAVHVESLSSKVAALAGAASIAARLLAPLTAHPGVMRALAVASSHPAVGRIAAHRRSGETGIFGPK